MSRKAVKTIRTEISGAGAKTFTKGESNRKPIFPTIQSTLTHNVKKKDSTERRLHVLNRSIIRSKKQVWKHKLAKLDSSNIKLSGKVMKKTISCSAAAKKIVSHGWQAGSG